MRPSPSNEMSKWQPQSLTQWFSDLHSVFSYAHSSEYFAWFFSLTFFDRMSKILCPCKFKSGWRHTFIKKKKSKYLYELGWSDFPLNFMFSYFECFISFILLKTYAIWHQFPKRKEKEKRKLYGLLLYKEFCIPPPCWGIFVSFPISLKSVKYPLGQLQRMGTVIYSCLIKGIIGLSK